MKTWVRGIVGAGLLFGAIAAHAAMYTENFEAPFPNWESGWFGQNSTAKNYYGVGQDRGVFLDGLGLQSVNGVELGGNIDFSFSDSFAPLITSFEFDVGSARDNGVVSLSVWDVNGVLLLATGVMNGDPYSDPGTFQKFTINSSTGIKRILFSGEGNDNPGGAIAIDNLKVTTSEASPVPLPAAAWLLLSGLGGLGALGRRRKA